MEETLLKLKKEIDSLRWDESVLITISPKLFEFICEEIAQVDPSRIAQKAGLIFGKPFIVAGNFFVGDYLILTKPRTVN